MLNEKVLLILGCILNAHIVLSLWSCSQDSDCSSLSGSTCNAGACVCPVGQQSVLGGTVCANLAPYHTSVCLEDHQCSRLLTTYECRREEDSQEGNCFCQPGNHYLNGRCWRTVNYGEPCTRDEECLGVLRDPFSLSCNGTCGCADGYYSRQRNECRRIGSAVGQGCVLDEDCQLEGGACNINTFACYDKNDDSPSNQTETETLTLSNITRTTREHGSACNILTPCPEPYVCSSAGACVCPLGYYAENGLCLAELGSPSTADQCRGLFAEVRDGICTCLANFYFEENMRECVKATRRITDSCVTDSNCHTFGAAARCGAPREPWPLRSCECTPELAVWDHTRDICRLFAGIGEYCVVDSDCLAGELEIQCVLDSYGNGTCTCPEGYIADGGLCLTTGLALGDACQATQECTETQNTVCDSGRCSCGNGYQEVDDFCAPIIGGNCFEDTDCVIDNTVCYNDTHQLTCQCDSEFVEYDDVCWPAVSGHNAACNVTAQCTSALGAASRCEAGACVCARTHHYRDGGCWEITGIFESCSSSSQCYLSDISERVVCRNGLCQCDFDYPYVEALHTCTSSASAALGSLSVITTAILYLFLS